MPQSGVFRHDSDAPLPTPSDLSVRPRGQSRAKPVRHLTSCGRRLCPPYASMRLECALVWLRICRQTISEPRGSTRQEKCMQFGDLRGWIAHLRREGEIHEDNAEVGWGRKVGTITRGALANGHDRVLLFS